MDDETVVSVRLEDHEDESDEDARRPCLIVLSGHTIGRVYPVLGDEVVIGRSTEADVAIEVPGLSRKHAKITRSPDGVFSLSDLGSTNGTFVEGERVTSHRLADGERIQLGAETVLKFSLQTAVEEEFQKRLYESAVHDHLTSAYNRRYFDEQLSREVSHTRRHKTPLSLLAIDVDHFKRVNDTYGHVVGDKVLAAIGTRILESIRHEDLFCRIGGEELAVIMRDTPAESAALLAERLRAMIAAEPIRAGDDTVSVTVSVGAATFDPNRHASADALLEAADRALYVAKRGGRDRVCVDTADD